MSYKIAPLILSPLKNPASTSDVFIAQPDSIKESLAGKLFIILEIINHKPRSLKIINYLLDRINYNYYQNEKVILRERISSLTVEHIFESSLSKTNLDFNEFLKAEKMKIRDLEMSITVGVIHENTLYFSNYGKNKVFLIYQQKDSKNKPNKNGNNEEIYKLSDITAQAGANEINKKEKIFSNVISGNIPDSGQFIITNEALPEYISTKQLTRIISTLPPTGAVEQIKNTLSAINAYVPFLGIIIKNTSNTQTLSKDLPSGLSTAQNSIVDLNNTEENTETLLAPSGMVNFKKWLRRPQAWLSKKRQPEPGTDSLLLKDKIYSKRKTPRYIKKIFSTVVNLITYLINAVYYLTKIISNRQSLKQSWQNIRTNFKTSWRQGLRKILLLNNRHKILLLTAIAFFSVFSVGIFFHQAQNKKQKIEADYQELARLIEKKQNQAEASLLYSNEEGAKKLFEEITNLMKKFPTATAEQKKRYQNFKDKLEAQLEKTRRVKRVDDTPELANILKINEHAKGDNMIFLPAQNKLYIADSGEKSIYIFDTSDNLITTATDLEHPITNLSYPVMASDKIIYYYNNGIITQFDTGDQTLFDIGLNLGADANQFKDIDTYNGRLYMLYPAKSQIYRYNKTANNFGSAYAWISDNTDLSLAIDIAIDGHIYVLLNNGDLQQFLRGQSTEFKLEAIDPPLENPTALKISIEQEFIYIMEPSKKRIIVYNKDGQFILQYKSNKFDKLVDFSVDEEHKIIYVLNATSIYGIEAAHIGD